MKLKEGETEKTKSYRLEFFLLLLTILLLGVLRMLFVGAYIIPIFILFPIYFQKVLYCNYGFSRKVKCILSFFNFSWLVLHCCQDVFLIKEVMCNYDILLRSFSYLTPVQIFLKFIITTMMLLV